MRQKVDIQDLRPGMYVSELDRPWRDTPFLFQGFHIESQADIEEIRKFCEYVFIETTQEHTLARPATAQDQRVELEMLRQSVQPNRREPVYADTVNTEEELQAARDTFVRCRETITSLMDDARMGRAFNADGARRDVERLAMSAVRNPDALMCLTQIKHKDEYTLAHSLRVAVLALAFGRHLGLSRPELTDLGLAALLHDIGKLRVPDEVLKKPDRLTPQEYRIMQNHVPEGVRILEKSRNVPASALEAAGQHHERFNGKGYMHGLKGDQISRTGMITAIVDCYDAVTSERAFQGSVSAHQALKKMYTWRNADFNGALVEQFIQSMGIYPVGSLVEMNTGHVGIVIGINRRRYLRPRINLILDAAKNRYAKIAPVDLSTRMRDDAGRPWEIKTVLEPGTYDLDPVLFLPKISGQLI